MNLAASLVVPQEKVDFSSPDVGAVNFYVGTTAVLPLNACVPQRCRSRQAFPILVLLDLIFLYLLLFLDLLFLFTFSLSGLSLAGLAFSVFAFLLDLIFFTYLTYTFAK